MKLKDPNKFDSNLKLTKNLSYSFPFNQTYKTILTIDKNEPKLNSLLFVFTKKNYPFYTKISESSLINLENVYQWIYKLSPAERVISYNEFWVKQKD